MKFLVDNQLPIALARFLGATFSESLHVRDLAMDETSDHAIWTYAKSHGYTIISKDEDFLYLSSMDSDGPAFVWVRLGNCRKEALFAAFKNLLPQLIENLQAGMKVVEIR